MLRTNRIVTVLSLLLLGAPAMGQEYPVQGRRVIWDEAWETPPVQYGPASQYVPGGRPLITNEVILSDVVVQRGTVEEVTVPSEGVLNVQQNVDGEPTSADPSVAEGNALGDRLDNLNEKIDDAVAELLKAHNDTTSYDEYVKSISAQNDAIKKMLTDRDKTLSKLEDSLSKQSSQTDANAEAINELMGKVDGLAKRNPGQGAAQVRKQLQSQSKKIDQLAASVAAASKAEDDGSGDEIKALSGKVDAAIQAMGAEKGDDASMAKLDAAMKAIAENAKKLDALSNKKQPAGNDKAIAELKKHIDEQSKKLDQLMAGADEQLNGQSSKIDELSKKLDATNKSLADTAKKASTGSSDELKSLSGKVDAAIQALGVADDDSKGDAQAAAVTEGAEKVSAKIDEALKAISANAKRLDQIGESGTSEEERQQFRKVLEAQTDKLESLAKKVEESKKSQAKFGGGALEDLKNSFSSQGKKSADTERKLNALMKSMEEMKRGAKDRDKAHAEEQAKRLKRAEDLLAKAKKDADRSKKRAEDIQKKAEESERRYREYIGKMKEAKEEKNEVEDEMADLMERLENASQRLDEVTKRAEHLAEHQAAEHADGHGADEHGEADGHEAHGDADGHGSHGETHGAHSAEAAEASKTESDDIDPLRKRLEAVKRRLEEAKKKK